VYFINKQKLAFSTLLLLAALSGCSENKSTAEYIAEAKVAFSNGQNSLAIINLKNVLKTEKNNLEARFLLGSVYAKQGLWVNAEKELRVANNAGLNDENINVLLAKVNYRLEDVDYLTSVMSLQKKYSDLAKLYLTIISVKQGDINTGRAILDEIILADSGQDINKLAMAWEYFLDADYSGSLGILDTLADIPVIKEDVIELRVANLVVQKHYKLAAEQLELFLSLHPQSHTHRLQLAEQYVKYRNYTEAEKNADLLLALYKNNIVLNRIKAEIKFNAKEYTFAKEFAETALRNSEDTLSKVIAGISAYQLGQFESSYNYLNSVSTYFPDGHPVNQIIKSLSNKLSFSTGQGDELLSDKVLALIDSGDYKQTRKLLNKAAESSGINNGVIDFQLGLLKIIEGDASYTDDFQRAISNGFSGVEPQVMLAQQYFKDKEYSKVIDIAESLPSSQEVIALLLKGSVYLEKGLLDKAIIVYDGILANEPRHMGAMFKLSEVYFKAGNLVKSTDLLKNIYSISASNVYAVRYLFKFSLESSNKKMLEQFFKAQIEIDKDNVNRHIVLAEFYLLHNEFEEALTITSRYLLKSPEQLEVFLLNTKALLSLNRINDVKNNLLTLEQIAPLHPEVIKNKAIILNVEGNKAEAIRVIEDFSNKNNNMLNDDLLLMLSTLYIESIKVLKAEEALSKIKNTQSTKYARVAGKMALIKGDSALAVMFLSKAHKYNPSQLVALELAQALQNEKKFDEAIELLERFITTGAPENSILVKYKLAELCEEKYPKKAERYYEQLLTETKGSVATLNNIAWFYYTQQRYVEGKKFASQAVKKAPELAAVHNTLGVLLLELGELPQAKHHLQTSVNIEPKNDKYKIWLSKCFILNGEKDRAKNIRSTIRIEALKPEIKMLFNDVFRESE